MTENTALECKEHTFLRVVDYFFFFFDYFYSNPTKIFLNYSYSEMFLNNELLNDLLKNTYLSLTKSASSFVDICPCFILW